jgi:ATP-dependent DNA helicase RecG
MVNLETPLKNLPHVTPKYAKTLEKLGLFSVCDLLLYFPFRYDDFRNTSPVSDDLIGKTITVEGKITKTKLNRIFKKRMTVVEATLEPARNATHSVAGGDANGTELKAVWFNQPFILESLAQGATVRLSGKLARDGKRFVMNSPAWERAAREETNTGRLVPVYSETVGLTSRWLRWQVKPLLPLAQNLPDILPGELREKYNLYDIYTAIVQLHFPDSMEKLVRAQKRFAFQEMFLVQLKSLQVKKEWENNNSVKIEFDETLIKNFVDSLPFKLTDAQRKASFEILKDLSKPKPMNRLLEGDVGSGKTVVAGIASLQAVSAGHQVAIMAPTEVLARQHFLSFSELFKDYEINIALLTSSYKDIKNFKFQISNFKSNPNDKITKKELLAEIKNGKINLAIGTHALIQKDVKFKNLALVIIDEQHRFGVAQRAALQSETMAVDDSKNKTIPHLLTMTATPIPRSLAIAFFGSLDLSILDEMPKNRKAIITKVIPPAERRTIYEFIRSEIKKGRQIFVILPLIEESLSETMADVKAATAEFERLSKDIFPEFSLGLLHGRLKAKEKEAVMRDFKEKKTQILVSTSVVEVGIDIPNATVMIIENAERFGLSQLHQFRGRVGRGEHQSYCFLFSGVGTDVGTPVPTRLKILEKTNDGFEISQEDLRLRGPGQFFGTIQSGLPDIAMENLSNIKLIKFAREEARNILQTDPQLREHPLLAGALKKFSEKIHLE